MIGKNANILRNAMRENDFLARCHRRRGGEKTSRKMEESWRSGEEETGRREPREGRMTKDERRVKNRERRGTFPREKERGQGRRRRVQHDQGGEKNRSLEK